MIIGLTGSLAAGKGVVSDFLKEQGFVYLSLSDELREMMKEKKIALTRENMQNFGNQMREEKGTGILAKLITDKINNQKYIKTVVDGIRNPAEIVELKKLDNYFLVAVDAPEEIRFKRLIERNRESDPKTLEDFLKVDARDKGIGEKETGQGVGRCMAQADFTLINDGLLEETKKKVEELYKKIQLRIPRPSWDEYFMKNAALVSERSTCIRHHVGAIIVKDKRIITTGYNGAAKGVKDCLELGCLRDELGIPSGTRHEICRAIHAEQNAIIQGAFHGISVKGGTLYCTHTPCMICAKMIANSGIGEVVSYHDYPDEEAKKFLSEEGIKLRKISRPKEYLELKD